MQASQNRDPAWKRIELERLWAHPQVAAWTSAEINAPQETLPDDLFAALRAALPVGTTIPTLGRAQPNTIVAVTDLDVDIAIARSTARGSGAQLVPAWMIELAWDYLRAHGELTNRRLLDDLNVRRSSAVCAMLARLPGVTVAATHPITLRLDRVPT